MPSGPGATFASSPTGRFRRPTWNASARPDAARLGLDLGQATMHMAVVAADLGIARAHSAAEDQEKAQTVLGFPDGKFLALVLSVGYPADRPLPVVDRPDRRPYSEVVHRGRRSQSS